MKNKLIVMAFTFFIMIALTPFVFGKLMNAKFNKMLNDIKSQGIELKEIKNKSSYIQTDRVFEVVITGDKLNVPEIEYVKAIVEAKFKNLPVTTVDFEGVVKEVKTKNFDNERLNALIKDKIKFFVTTPNFKVYNYKLYDTSFNLNDAILKIKGINGVVVYPLKNSLNIALVEIKGMNAPFILKIKNIKTQYEKKQNEIITSNMFDVEGDFQKLKFALNNFKAKSIAIFSASKVNGINDASFNVLKISNIFEIKNTKLNLKFKDLDKEIVTKIQHTKNEAEKQKLLMDLISKGFKVDAKLNITDIKYSNNDLGFFDLSAHINIKPDKNIEAKIQNKNFNFVNFELNLKTSPKIATMLMMLEPEIAIILQNAKSTKNSVEINIKKIEDKIYINGKEKSN